MPLPTTGAISFNDLQTEFGGAHPIALNEFYAGGGLVPPAAHGPNGLVPTSGEISMDKFYGSSSIAGVMSGAWTANSTVAIQPFEVGLPTFYAGKYWAFGNAPDYGMYTSIDGIQWDRETIVTAGGTDYSYSHMEVKIVFEHDTKLVVMCRDSPSWWIICSGGTSWTDPLPTGFISEFDYYKSVDWIAPLSKYVVTLNDNGGANPYPITVTTDMFNNIFPLPTIVTAQLSAANTYSTTGKMVSNNSGSILMKSAASFNNPGIFKSINSGSTWGFTTGVGFTYGLAHSPTTNLFIACSSGALFTSPTGSTWTNRAATTAPHFVACKDNIVLAVSTNNDSALDCSLTGGTTWQQVAGPNALRQVTDFGIVNGRFFLCGYVKGSVTNSLANYRIYSISATE